MIYPMLKAALRLEAYNASLILIHVFLLGAICIFSARLFVSEAENFVQKMTRNCITAAAFFGLIVCIQAVLLSILKHFGIDPFSSADPDQGILFFFELLLYAPLCDEIVFRACLIDECAAPSTEKSRLCSAVCCSVCCMCSYLSSAVRLPRSSCFRFMHSAGTSYMNAERKPEVSYVRRLFTSL